MQTDQLPIVRLDGTPRERGRQHGEALREQIGDHIARTKEWLAQDGADPDALIAEFLSAVGFAAAAERWTPGVVEEVAGIAEGAGQPAAEVATLQYIDELWWYTYYRARDIQQAVPEACSSLGVITDSGVIIGQTMDLPAYTEGLQALLHLAPTDDAPEAFVITLAGTVACYGVNRAGVGICCNTLLQLNHDQRGLPVAYVVRGVLRQRSFADAATFIETVAHASGQNYLVGDPQQIASFESGAGEVARYWPLPTPTRTYHTNHPLVNRATQQYTAAHQLSEADIVGSSANSSARLAVLHAHLSDLAKPLDIADLRAVLTSREDATHPICRLLSDGGGYTAATLLYELSADPPVLHLAAGPLLASDMHTFAFDRAAVAVGSPAAQLRAYD